MSKVAALVLVVVSVAAAAVDPALLQLAPPETRGLAGFNVRQVKASPFGQFVLTQAGAANKDFESFIATTGFDPRYNLDEILISTNADPGAPATRGLLVARGTFTPSKIVELARSAGAEIAVYNGVEIITPKNTGVTAGEGAFMAGPSLAFFDSSLAVAGDDASVRGAIDRRQGGRGPSADLTAKAGEVSGTYDFWFVSLLPVPQAGGPEKAPAKDPGEAIKSELLKVVESASGGIKFGDTVRLAVELLTHSEQDAANLASVLKFVSGIAAFQQGKQGLPPGLEAILKSLDLKAQGKAVQISLAVPEQELERLIQQAKQGGTVGIDPAALAAPKGRVLP